MHIGVLYYYSKTALIMHKLIFTAPTLIFLLTLALTHPAIAIDESNENAFDLFDIDRFMLGGRLILEDTEARLDGQNFDESELRQFRIRPSYSFNQNTKFVAAFELSNNQIDIPNIFLEWKNGPLRLRFGQAKIITGLDVASSRLAISYISRPAIVELTSGLTRQTGIAARYNFGNFVYHGGVYTEALSDGGDESATNIASRLVWTRELASGERVHIGGAARYRRRNDDNSFLYRLRPETRALPRLINSTRLSNEDTLLSGEFLYQNGPFTFNSEALYLRASDSESSGVYADIGWFFGGKRGYQSSNARLELSDINQGIFHGGYGALELAFRLDFARLQDDGSARQNQFAQELAVIWHLEPNIRIVANAIHAEAKTIGQKQTINVLNVSLQFSL
jgi:phosphate-selective porin OprO/OprP